jgi:hypothetical protein
MKPRVPAGKYLHKLIQHPIITNNTIFPTFKYSGVSQQCVRSSGKNMVTFYQDNMITSS